MTEPSAPPTQKFTALVLAADRGADDPVARAGGKSCKSLVPVAGVPMLERVVSTLAASPWIDRIAVSLGDTALLSEFSGLHQAVVGGRAFAVQAQNSPSHSVLHAVEQLDNAYPLLITTSDHALLTGDMIDYFCLRSMQSGADVCAGLTSSEILLASYPDSIRTYLKFRDGYYSGSNLFALMTEAGIEGPRIWRQAEQHRKQPWKIARVFGAGMLVGYLFRRLTLAAAFDRVGGNLGLALAPIEMPYAEAAIDVDTPADLKMVEDIIRRNLDEPGLS